MSTDCCLRFASISLFVLLLIWGCSSSRTPLDKTIKVECASIPVKNQVLATAMYGPEDLVVDTYSRKPRLIVSSSNRREESQPGKMFQIDLQSREIRELSRINEPNDLPNPFRPHGIDLQRSDSGTMLYVVLHATGNEPERVVQYQAEDDHLRFIKSFPPDPRLVSGNDVQGVGENEFYVTNTSSSRNPFWRFLEGVLQIKNSPTLHFNGGANLWRQVGDPYVYGNGVLLVKDRLLVTDTARGQIRSMAISGFPEEEKVETISLPDNINNGTHNDILIASHNHWLSFILHRYGLLKSGGAIIRADLQHSHKMQDLFVTDGIPISAPSSAVYYEGVLYIGQVFDPFILAVPIPKDKLDQTYACQ